MAFEHDELATGLRVPDARNAARGRQHPLAIQAEDRRGLDARTTRDHAVQLRGMRRSSEPGLELAREQLEPWDIARCRIALERVAHGAVELSVIERGAGEAGEDEHLATCHLEALPGHVAEQDQHQ